MKRVLLDVDGVVADFVGLYLDLVISTVNPLGRQFNREAAQRRWDVGESLGLTENEKAKTEAKIGNPGTALFMKVLSGAVDAVAKLEQLVDVYFVTSPWDSSGTWMHDRAHWLERYFGTTGKNVIHTRHKHVCTGGYFVDDKVENVNKWGDHNVGRAILWEQPWNRSAKVNSNCLVVSGWSDLIKVVSEDG